MISKHSVVVKLTAACLCALFAIAIPSGAIAEDNSSIKGRLTVLEQAVFGAPSTTGSMVTRLDALDAKVFGRSDSEACMADRLTNLEAMVLGGVPQP
jgi:hypothetical protein